jgi:hypothetical protein
MRRSVPLYLVVLFLGLSACGSSSDATSTGLPTTLVTNGTFTATVNGTAWGALGRVIVTRPTANSVSLFAVSTTYGFSIVLLNVTGPTTVSLVNAPSNGSQVIASGPGQGGWATGQTGGTGSVVITALTTNHITGTFSFDATPIPGTPTTGTLHVTSGAFDLSY